MENAEHKLPPEPSFSQRPDADERIAAYQEAVDQTNAERAREFGGGITTEPKPGKRYAQLKGPDNALALRLTYGDEVRGGAVLEIANGAFVEVDGNGQPINSVIREHLREEAGWKLVEANSMEQTEGLAA